MTTTGTIPIRSGGPVGECVTPTGAALLRVLVDEFEPDVAWVPEAIGYGAGTRDDPVVPNLLRFSVGEAKDSGAQSMIIVAPRSCWSSGRSSSAVRTSSASAMPPSVFNWAASSGAGCRAARPGSW